MKVRFALMIGIPLTTTLLLASCAMEDQSKPAALPSHSPFVTGVSTIAPTMTPAPLSPTHPPTLIPTPPPAATPIMPQGLSPTPTLIPTSPPAATLAPGQSPSPTTTLPPAAATFLAELNQLPTRTIQIPPSPTLDLRPTATPYPTVSLDKPWLRFEHSDFGFTFEYPEGTLLTLHDSFTDTSAMNITIYTSENQWEYTDIFLTETDLTKHKSVQELYEKNRELAVEDNTRLYENGLLDILTGSQLVLRNKGFQNIEGFSTVDNHYFILAVKYKYFYRFALRVPQLHSAEIFQRILRSIEIKE